MRLGTHPFMRSCLPTGTVAWARSFTVLRSTAMRSSRVVLPMHRRQLLRHQASDHRAVLELD